MPCAYFRLGPFVRASVQTLILGFSLCRCNSPHLSFAVLDKAGAGGKTPLAFLKTITFSFALPPGFYSWAPGPARKLEVGGRAGGAARGAGGCSEAISLGPGGSAVCWSGPGKVTAGYREGPLQTQPQPLFAENRAE